LRWKLVDSIDELVLDEKVVGRKVFHPEEAFFEDHFPGFPVVPGVLILESLAQISGKLIGYSVRLSRGDWPFPILSMMNKVKFRKFIRPGQEITLEGQIIELRSEFSAVRVRAKVGKKVHAQAEQVFVFNAVPLDDEAERERVESIERAELHRLWKDCPESEQ
jgi:3-hydroxymyristoyl/3-hydroxydecanoyl-(acyl carrier protein) dehydratase